MGWVPSCDQTIFLLQSTLIAGLPAKKLDDVVIAEVTQHVAEIIHPELVQAGCSWKEKKRNKQKKASKGSVQCFYYYVQLRHLPNQQRTLNKLPTLSSDAGVFVNLSTDRACKSAPNVHKKRACNVYEAFQPSFRFLRATVGGWAVVVPPRWGVLKDKHY